MPAPVWRMNGVWRKVAGVLVLCALLLSNDVVCDDDDTATVAPTTDPAAHPATSPAADPSAAAATDAAGSAVTPGVAAPDAMTTVMSHVSDNSTNPASGNSAVSDVDDGGSSGITAASVDSSVVTLLAVLDQSPNAVLQPEVICVDQEEKSLGVMISVATADCEETKRIIQGNSAGLCTAKKCQLKLFQSGKTLKVYSEDAQLDSLVKVIEGERLNGELPGGEALSSGQSVFTGILVSGLLAAVGIVLGYFKCQGRFKSKTGRLAEEAHPLDQDNQGNTLVSVAPLNPPAETQEKPSVNGESPEPAKTQPPPPTNGHSTTKTADTEM